VSLAIWNNNMCESLVGCDVDVNAMKKHHDLHKLGQKKNDEVIVQPSMLMNILKLIFPLKLDLIFCCVALKIKS